MGKKTVKSGLKRRQSPERPVDAPMQLAAELADSADGAAQFACILFRKSETHKNRTDFAAKTAKLAADAVAQLYRDEKVAQKNLEAQTPMSALQDVSPLCQLSPAVADGGFDDSLGNGDSDGFWRQQADWSPEPLWAALQLQHGPLLRFIEKRIKRLLNERDDVLEALSEESDSEDDTAGTAKRKVQKNKQAGRAVPVSSSSSDGGSAVVSDEDESSVSDSDVAAVLAHQQSRQGVGRELLESSSDADDDVSNADSDGDDRDHSSSVGLGDDGDEGSSSDSADGRLASNGRARRSDGVFSDNDVSSDEEAPLRKKVRFASGHQVGKSGQEGALSSHGEDESHPSGDESPLENEFFSLRDMERFIREDEESLAQAGQAGSDDSSDDSDGSDSAGDFGSAKDAEEALALQLMYGDEDYKTQVDKALGVDVETEVKYAQFFDEPEPVSSSGGSDGDDRHFDEFGDLPDDIRDQLQEAWDQEEERTLGSAPDGDADDDDDGEVSVYQRRAERLHMQIAELEQKLVDKKDWTQMGEVSSKQRPLNSLLEEHVDFDVTQRLAPVVTPEMTASIEDMIRGRIKDKAFDDVIRKLPASVSRREPKQRVELDDEKSQLSLAEVYEQEFLQQMAAHLDADNAVNGKAAENADAADQGLESELTDDQREALLLFRKVTRKLDALANFSYAPKFSEKPAGITQSSKQPTAAISMEDAQPTAVSTASTLAPAEVFRSAKFGLQGETEVTSSEKQARRRRQKVASSKRTAQRTSDRSAAKAADARSMNAGRGSVSSDVMSQQQAVDTLRGEKNVSFVADSRGVTTSSALFKQLQDEREVNGNDKGGKKRGKPEPSRRRSDPQGADHRASSGRAGDFKL